MCILNVSILHFSTILIFDLGIVPTVWYFWGHIITITRDKTVTIDKYHR